MRATASSKRPMRRIFLVILLAAVFHCADRANAGGDLLRLTPSDAGLVVRVENATAMRDTRAGLAASEIVLSIINEDGKTAERWSALSAQLGWSEAETFDRLFGRSFAIVGARLWDEAPSSWALVSIVDRKTDVRLRKRLPASPRTIVDGSPVLSLEDGAFEMALRRDGLRTTLVFARRGDSYMFDRVAAALANGVKRPVALEQAAIRLMDRGVAEILLWASLPPETGGARVALGARVHDDQLELRLISEFDEPLPDVAPWSIGEWRALAEGSLMAVIERLPDMESKRSDPFFGPVLELDLLPWLTAEGEEAETLGQRHAVAIHGHPEGGLTLSGGVRLTGDGAAVAADSMMRRMVSWLSATLQLGSWDYDFEGHFPEATRRVRLSEADGPRFPLVGGDGFELAWTSRPAQEEGARWLVASTSAERAGALAGELAVGRPAGGVGRWLSVGTVKPSGLIDAAEAGGVQLPGPLASFRLVDLIGWRVEAVDSSLIEGRGMVRFADEDIAEARRDER